MKEFFTKVLSYIKTRGLGFFFLLPVVVLSIITAFVYLGGFGGTPYYSAAAMAMPFITALCVGFAFFKPTARYAPIVMFVMTIVSLILFVNATYMHLADVFYSGIGPNPLAQAGGHFSSCVILFVLDLLLCGAAAFMRQYKNNKDNVKEAVA